MTTEKTTQFSEESSEKEQVIVDKNVAQEANVDDNQQILQEMENSARKFEQEITIEDKNYETMEREVLVSELKDIVTKGFRIEDKDVVEKIKNIFYKKFNEEIEVKKAKFVEDGSDVADFAIVPDRLDVELKELLAKYRDQKSLHIERIEKEKKENLNKKYEVIEKLKTLVEDTEFGNDSFNVFKELRNQWNSIGHVPQADVKVTWDKFNRYAEKFYDILSLNKEFRELDFKKNLEIKEKICIDAENLAEETSIITAFKTLQRFHERWREVGPVTPDRREELWERFSNITKKINVNYHDHFKDIRKEQEDNLKAKTILCEKSEELAAIKITVLKQWNETTKEILELQRMWKQIGFAPKKENNAIYDRFRSACDTFFAAKRLYHEELLTEQKVNLQKKYDICERAEALRESEDWKKTTNELISLQKKWKAVGPVPWKKSDDVWKRFRSACDDFFHKKEQYYKNIDKTYDDNLQHKYNLIKEVEAYVVVADDNINLDVIKNFQQRWSEIGFVPFKQKEEVYSAFRVAIDRIYEKLNIDKTKLRLDKFKLHIEGIKDSTKALEKEQSKVIRKVRELTDEINILENNMGFFTQSKGSESLMKEFEVKIKKIRETISLFEQKLNIINNI